MLKTATTGAINYEKDRFKRHWRVNGKELNIKRNKQENKLFEIEDYDGKYIINNVIVEIRTYFLWALRFLL